MVSGHTNSVNIVVLEQRTYHGIDNHGGRYL